LAFGSVLSGVSLDIADAEIGLMILQSAADGLPTAAAGELAAGELAGGVADGDVAAAVALAGGDVAAGTLLELLDELLQPAASRPAAARARTVRDLSWDIAPPWGAGSFRKMTLHYMQTWFYHEGQ
jgi:hypothetical protein